MSDQFALLQTSAQVVALLLMALRLGKQRGVLSETMLRPEQDLGFALVSGVNSRESELQARLNSYCAALNSVPDVLEKWQSAQTVNTQDEEHSS